MRFVGNLIWLILAGLWLCVAYLIAGALNCVTIIGIPFGLQSFKLAGYALWPFGRAVVRRPGSIGAVSFIGNLIWLMLGGLVLALLHLLAGLLLCATVIGIPLGLGSFKMARLALTPFGKLVVPKREIRSTDRVLIGPVDDLQSR